MIEIGSHGYSHPVIPLARWQALLQSNLPSTCGRHAKIPDGDAERPRLVDEIVLDAGAREDDQPGGHRVDHPVVALERGRLLVAVAVGPEIELRQAAGNRPAGSGALGAGGRSAMAQPHVGVAGMDMIDRGPRMLRLFDRGSATAGGAAP